MSRRVLRGGEWAGEALRQLPAAADSWLRQEGRVLKADRHSVVALMQLQGETLSLIHISEPTRRRDSSRMPSAA